jgi:hypothetical protein
MTVNLQLQHPKAKEWLISAAKNDYQELAKLASEHPNLVKLQVSGKLSNYQIPLSQIYRDKMAFIIRQTQHTYTEYNTMRA